MLNAVSLTDRFLKRDGQIVITGVQALVRLMLLQAERDQKAGLKTGGFVSGYRGSPLGTLDLAFMGAGALPADAGIIVKPAVNEEMAATAIAGTQQIEHSPGARVEGVFSLWYGKGPGVDRASDAIRHGNLQGTSSKGGVVLAVGDDHVAKSSSIVCNSDETVASVQAPLFFPSDPHEIVLYGLHAFASSRLTGSWLALKIITEVADSTRAVSANELDAEFVLPEIAVPPTGLHNRWPETPLEQEARQQDYRLPGVLAYVRANKLDRIVQKSAGARIGIVSAGKSWLDTAEALRLLGLDEARLGALGVALYKPALIWPMEPERLKEFAAGLNTLIVVEEKSGLMEGQIKAILYGPEAPAVMGKVAPDGRTLFPKTGDLTPERVAAQLGQVLHGLTGDEGVQGRLAGLQKLLGVQDQFATPPAIRKPFFCSGCPHNRSTVLPEGSRALAGIGCHGLAAYNRPATTSFAQMGGEGVHWMGLAPFTDEPHIFANLGDGTYFHSGLLAIRQAVAVNLNITYKLLYNSAVAMTGGQSVDGELSVEQTIDQLRAEGVRTIVVSTDDPDRYPKGGEVRAKANRVEHRDNLQALQEELRATPGVSVIVYEQMCATEKRRLRKRGRMEDPTKRVFINELVCEGCGDCSVKSNCLSVEPAETSFGTKRRINQSTCNKDYSCLNGFCPSFVTVSGGRVRKAKVAETSGAGPLPAADAARTTTHQRVLVAGVGGTGVVTIGALLSMAGHMTGRKTAVLDQVGMAQKGGAVTSHIHVASEPITALRIPPGQADLVIACDQIVGNTRDVIASVQPGHTRVIANGDVSITGDFTQNPGAVADASFLARRLSRAVGQGGFVAFPFTKLAEKLLGDAIGANLMMVGVAYQKGWLDLDLEAFEAAINLNGVGVGMNLAAFEWGRRLAVNAEEVYAAADMAPREPDALDEIVAKRTAFLTDYQDAAYAARYRQRIEAVRRAESALGDSEALARAVAQSLFKFMAYKDEYEVARLYVDPGFRKALSDQFEGDFKLAFHLAPPSLGDRKRRFGGWMMAGFQILARLRGLRGTAFDPFARTPERRTERALIAEYEQVLDRLLADLTPENIALAAEIAVLPMAVRGYGHVKDKAVAAYRAELAQRLSTFGSKAADDGSAPAAISIPA